MYDHILSKIYEILEWSYLIGPLSREEIEGILICLGYLDLTPEKTRYIISKDKRSGNNIIRMKKKGRCNYYYYDPLKWHIRNGM